MKHKLGVSAIIEQDVSIGEGSFVWYFTHIMEGAKIGRDCSIGEKSFIGKKVMIGDGVKVGNNVNIYEGAIIKDNVFIGNNVSFTNVRFPKAKAKARKFLDTIVQEDVSIGANATIVGGIEIGRGSIVADGAVVIGDVEAGVFVAGNPARVKYKLDDKKE